MAANKWAIMGGVALNVEYTRKYAFDATAAAKVTAKLVAVPPPSLFQEAVQADIAGRAQRAAMPSTVLAQPPVVAPPVITSPTTRLPSPFPVAPTVNVDEDEEFTTLSLIIEEKAGLGYTLDDGVVPASTGEVAEDGLLIHRVSKWSTGCVITFDDGSTPVELKFATLDDEDDDSIDEFSADWAEHVEELADMVEEPEALEESEDESDEGVADEEIADLIASWTDDDEPTLTLLLPEYAGKNYTLDDGITTSEGVIDEDGLLVQPISPDAVGCTIEIEGEAQKIQLSFSEDDGLA